MCDTTPLTPLEQKLFSMDIKKFSEFDLSGNRLVCKVLRVHDGDTCTIGFKWSTKFYKKNIRLTGLDCPELHSKVPKESQLCRLGREYISSQYLNKLAIVEMGPMDKYGRILVTLYDRDSGESVNQKMIDYKFARTYGGDLHKDQWSTEELDAGIVIAGGLELTDPGK